MEAKRLRVFDSHSRFTAPRSEGQFVVIVGDGDLAADTPAGIGRCFSGSIVSSVLGLGTDEVPVMNPNVERKAFDSVPVLILAARQSAGDVQGLTFGEPCLFDPF